MNRWYRTGQELIDEMKNTKLPEGLLPVWFLGQAGIAVKAAGKLICIDPYLRENPDRQVPPPFTPEVAADVFDYILCTHDHEDHLDRVAIEKMAAAGTRSTFVVPYPFSGLMHELGIPDSQVIPAKAWEELDTCCFKITPVPAAHESFEYDDQGNHKFLGYILNLEGITLYHSGDTIEWDSMVAELSRFSYDIMCLPINGSDWKRKHMDIIGNLDAREAADISAQCHADLLLPIHYDMFAFNGENPGYLADYMFRNYPARRYHFLAPGEMYIYQKKQ